MTKCAKVAKVLILQYFEAYERIRRIEGIFCTIVHYAKTNVTIGKLLDFYQPLLYNRFTYKG